MVTSKSRWRSGWDPCPLRAGANGAQMLALGASPNFISLVISLCNFILFIYLFILAVLCGLWDLSCPTGNWTLVPSSDSP